MPESVQDRPKAPVFPPVKWLATAGAAMMAVTATVEYAMGRRAWGTGGTPGFWSSGINSEHNSQYLLDPYSFTHVIHGVLFYGLLWLAARKWPVPVRMLAALIVESTWEMLENSDFIIDRYRAQTISVDYYGDSIVNSMADIMAAMLGFCLAWRLPPLVMAAGVIAVEAALALTVRDNLTINVIMLIHPVQAIRTWQAGS
jgi:hypothetical protein